MSIPRKIAYNVIFSSSAKILSTIAALVGIGLITRYLGQEGFGRYATALAFLSFFGAMGDWGIYQAATLRISRPKSDEKKVISNAMGLRITISLVVVILAPLIAFFLPYSKELKIAIIFVAFSYTFSSFYQVLVGIFQKNLRMDFVTGSELVGKIIQVSLIVIGVLNDWGFYFIIITLLINMIINFSFVFILSRRFIKFKPAFDFVYWKDFLKQSIPIGLAALVTFIYFKADTILLSLMKPQADVGIYGAAYKVIENISFFPAMIVGLTLPMFSYNIFNNKEKFKNIVNKNFKVFFILIIPLVIGTLFLAEGIINLIAGPEFSESAIVLKIIIIASALIFFGHLFTNILISANLQKKLFIVLSLCAIFNVTSNLILIPKFSYLATASVSVATEFLVVALTGFIIYRNLNFIPNSNKIIWILLCGFLMAMFLWLTIDFNFFIRLFFSPLIYLGSLVVFNVISKNEILSLIKREHVIQK
ncbi:MAG: flippase [Patescibacteria group bacterium]|jgi:O-antigen/teichoic acid export membrane protein|nr:flippase [Patescibacteria group bacterium]